MENDLIFLVIGTSAMLVLILAIVIFTFLYQKKIYNKQQELYKIQSLLQTEELKSAYALLEGKDNERQRIATDLHDRMGGQLSTIKIYLDLLEQTDLSLKQSEFIEKLHKSTDLTIEEVRSIAHDLGNSTLDNYGFKKAIEQLVDVINESKKLKINCSISLSSDLPSALSREMYQVVQEMMTNTLRHSNASKVSIDISYVKHDLSIIFEDNGIGFNPEKQSVGVGLKSIRLRVERLNGILTIDSKPERGSAFIIEINLADDKN